MKRTLSHLRKTLYVHYPQGEADAILWLLLEKRFGLSRTAFYMGKDKTFSENERIEIDNILKRLIAHEPIHYILKEADFGNLRFRVERDVLIPRPETAELVNWICCDFSQSGLHILDAGTGSGCIAISLASRISNSQVEAWDISPIALSTCTENAILNKVDIVVNEVDILSHDLPKNTNWDLIVSNPPYVKNSERIEMETNVLDYEPALALFVPDDDPLKFYHALALYGKETLVEGGAIYFEINQALGREMIEMMDSLGYRSIELRKDSFDKDRMLKAIR